MAARRAGREIVVLGMLAKMPVPGVLWQTLHYLVGLQRLGFDPVYVEAHARTPSMLMREDTDDAAGLAAAVIDGALRPYGLGGRWAYHALHDDGRVYGMAEGELARVLRDAELLINLHGGTEPREELVAGNRLVYLETDPVQLQIELHDGLAESREFLAAHCAHFTFAENLGGRGCTLPVCADFDFRPTRQPVVTDLWADGTAPGPAFTTIGNFRQRWRDVSFGGATFGWSKDALWRPVLGLPGRTGQAFELALSGYEPRDEQLLAEQGWALRPALDFGTDMGAYRRFVVGSLAEFTVAKEQNVHFRTGWFSDRSATYLAAGRAVITQDTGFGDVLPTGEGLLAFDTPDAAADAVERVASNPRAHGRRALEIAREHFEAERVLGRLIGDLGVALPRTSPTITERSMSEPAQPKTTQPAHRRRRLDRESTVLALIPHFRCEQYLDDVLASLTAQTRPLDGIVVIDDSSDDPPIDIVRRHPEVTLMRSTENVGPYRLVQQIIDETGYDAYMFQDADDWSAPDRLEHLLLGAEESGAELIGSQEVRVFCDEPEVVPIQWPLDVNAPLAKVPTAFPLLHPTSLVSRDLLKAIGGFSSGLRFGGDAEMLRRAHFIARVVNVDHHGYFRRIRQGSLTTAPATAIGTPARVKLMEETFAKANRNHELVGRGETPDLSPLRTGDPVRLERLTGPRLLHSDRTTNRRPRAAAPAPAPVRTTGPISPVFVIGADHSGAAALACAIGQHPAIPLSVEGGWAATLAERLAGVRDAALEADDRAFGLQPPSADELAAGFAEAAAEAVAGGARRWVDGSWRLAEDVPALARLFPDARFIHVVRSVHAAVRAISDPVLGAPGATGGTQVPARLRTKVPEQAAVERWLAAVEAGVQAETELGSERVMAVAHEELVADPEGTVRRCLEFLDEEFRGECMRPLRELRTLVDDSPLEPDADPVLWQRAVALSGSTLAATDARAARDRRSSRRGRIVMVTDHFPKVSETFFVRKFCGLLARGWDVHVVCQRSNDEHWEFFPELREQIRHQGRLHVARDGVDQVLERLDPDVVHFGYGVLAYGRMHLRAQLGCRIVTSFRGFDLNSFRLDEPLAYSEVWRDSDVVHVVSESLAERALERGCPPDKERRVIVDATDVSAFVPPAERDRAVGTAERPLRLLSVGRLHWKKGHEHALAAVRRLVDRGIEVELHIAGEGEHREPTEYAVGDLGLDGRVRLLGAVTSEDVRDELAWADVFVHPSLTEAFGVAVIEAQAMGLPVVCSDAGGLPENVEHGVTGFVVGRRDDAAIADAIERLARDGELRHRMGAAARRRAETALDETRQLDAFEELYRELLDDDVLEPAGTEDEIRRRRAAELDDELERLEQRLDQVRRQLWRQQVVECVHAWVDGTLPASAKVVVVSRGDEEILAFPRHRGAHFMQAPEGHYAGHHPADSTEAIERLEALREQGATHLVVPATAAWWLEHYGEFARHLEEGHRRVGDEDERFVAYALEAAGA